MQKNRLPRRQAPFTSPESPEEPEDDGSGGSGGGGAGEDTQYAPQQPTQLRPKTPEPTNEVTLYRLESAQGKSALRNESYSSLFARTLLLILGLLSVGSAAAILTLLVLAHRLNIYYSLECSVLILQSVIGIYVALTKNRILILLFALICLFNACAIVGLLVFNANPSESDQQSSGTTMATTLSTIAAWATTPDSILNRDVPALIDASARPAPILNRQKEHQLKKNSTETIPSLHPISKTTNTTAATTTTTVPTDKTTKLKEAFDDDELGDVRDNFVGYRRLEAASRPAKLLDRLKAHGSSRKSVQDEKDRRLVIVAYILWVAIFCDLFAAIIAVLLFNLDAGGGNSSDSRGMSQTYTHHSQSTDEKPPKSPLLLLVHKTVDRASNQDAYMEILRPTIRTGRLDQALPFGAEPLATTNVRKPSSKLGIGEPAPRRRPRSRATLSPQKVRPVSNHKMRKYKDLKYKEVSPRRQMAPGKEMKRKYLEKRPVSPTPDVYSYQPVHKLADEPSTIIAKLKEVRGMPKFKSSAAMKSISSDNLLRAVTRTGSLREDPTSAGF